MFLTSALALVLCLTRCGAWDTTRIQKRAHYIANLNVVMQLFEEVFTAHNISKDRFTIKTFRGVGETFEEGLLRILVGEEHNVILPGGSHMPAIAVPGQLYSRDGKQRYMVGLEEVYNQCELMCEYSMLNIVNIQHSALFTENFLDKFVYTPALPFEYAPTAGAHTKYPLYTTYGYTSPQGDRRTEVNADLANLGHPVENLHYQTLEEYMAICDDAKILINVHQTYWHHTLEEFRVLPSLQRGVIVVSEWVPAIETIPFHEYMIFAPYEELVATVAEVLGNYSHYHERIFGPKSGLGALLRDMRARARQQLESRVLKVASMKPSEIEANRVTFFREGVLVKGAGASIYQIRNSSRCEFESASTFAAQGHEFGQELFVHDVYIAKLPLIGYC